MYYLSRRNAWELSRNACDDLDWNYELVTEGVFHTMDTTSWHGYTELTFGNSNFTIGAIFLLAKKLLCGWLI